MSLWDEEHPHRMPGGMFHPLRYLPLGPRSAMDALPSPIVAPHWRGGPQVLGRLDRFSCPCSGSRKETFAPCHQAPRLRCSSQLSARAGVRLDGVRDGRTRCNGFVFVTASRVVADKDRLSWDDYRNARCARSVLDGARFCELLIALATARVASVARRADVTTDIEDEERCCVSLRFRLGSEASSNGFVCLSYADSGRPS